MTRPKLLDLYCCQGGAAMGFHRAGFDVLGVDINPQPRYPFQFVQADALQYLADFGHLFDAVHASPPCHDHSTLSSISGKDGTEHLLEDTRAVLLKLTSPWTMENVGGAVMPGAFVLCGSMFGLGSECRDGKWRQLRRHRKFEYGNFAVLTPTCAHKGQPVGVYGQGGMPTEAIETGDYRRGYQANAMEAAEALGIDWMSRGNGLSQAIPPAYTQYLGEFMIDQLSTKET